jgi:predicted amino acid dehydrogenase
MLLKILYEIGLTNLSKKEVLLSENVKIDFWNDIMPFKPLRNFFRHKSDPPSDTSCFLGRQGRDQRPENLQDDEDKQASYANMIEKLQVKLRELQKEYDIVKSENYSLRAKVEGHQKKLEAGTTISIMADAAADAPLSPQATSGKEHAKPEGSVRPGKKERFVERHNQVKVAFISHPADMDLYRAYIRHLNPNKSYSDKLLIKLCEWAPSYKVTEWCGLNFNDNDFFDALLIMVPFLPEMRDIRLRKLVEKIDQALSIASQNGCSVATLGAFTSIVLQGQENDFAQKHEIKLTSGNTFTAAIIVRSIEKAAEEFGVDIRKATLGIVGASGDIGSGCVSYFGNRVKKMILTARSTYSLEHLLQSRKDNMACEVEITTDNNKALQASDIIIFVTSAYVPMYSQDDFKPGTIVCDASAPQNVTVADPLRKDVFIYHGGIVSLPFTLDPGFDIGLASLDTFYGCQIEGILLALDNALPCSWGRGNITAEKISLFLKKMDSLPNLGLSFSVGKHVYSNKDLNQYCIQLSQLKKNEGVENVNTSWKIKT